MKKIKGVFRFNIKKNDNQEAWWIVDAKNGNGALKFMAQGERLTPFATVNEQFLVCIHMMRRPCWGTKQ